MEKVTQTELQKLGIADSSIEEGRICFTGGEEELARACIFLRSADRIFWQLGEFSAETFDQLFEGIYAIPWEKILPRDAVIAVSAKCIRSRLMSVSDTQSITKKAIIKALQRKYKQERFSESGPVYPIEIAIRKDNVTVSLDCCGEGLHKRGYRIRNAEAPLRETLAAGLLLLCRYNGQQPFLDPFCGSGTLPIEAALLAGNIAPGKSRSFIWESWPGANRALWQRMREEAKDGERPVSAEILGSDISDEMIEMSRFHAQKAGLDGKITFVQRPVRELALATETGLCVTNPPYGQRLGDQKQAAELYRALGKVFLEAPGWSLGVLTAAKDFERAYGRRSDKTRRLYNANLECGFYQYFPKRG